MQCHSLYAQIQIVASGLVNGAVNDLSRNDADRQNKFIFRIHCNLSKIDETTHTPALGAVLLCVTI